MGKTAIEWTNMTWNPISGCTKAAQGCKNCYAKTLHDMRHKAYKMGKKLPAQYAVPFEMVQMHPARLEAPLHWHKPQMVFVNSVSDLFHERLYEREQSFLNEIFAIMAATPQHTYQVLTKRPHLMQRFISEPRREVYVEHALETIYGEHGWHAPDFDWPLPNVWLGTSISTREDALWAVPYLLQTPAAVRFVSAEPLLGPVRFEFKKEGFGLDALNGIVYDMDTMLAIDRWNRIDWVIAGGESGPGARPMHVDWARSLRDQCQAAGVPFFFKQWGEYHPEFLGRDFEAVCAVCGCSDNDPCEGGCYWSAAEPENDDMRDRCSRCAGVQSHRWPDGSYSYRVGKRVAGDSLDGQIYHQFPEPRMVQP